MRVNMHDQTAGTKVAMCVVHAPSSSRCPRQHHMGTHVLCSSSLVPSAQLPAAFNHLRERFEWGGRDGGTSGSGQAADPCAEKLFGLVLVGRCHRGCHA